MIVLELALIRLIAFGLMTWVSLKLSPILSLSVFYATLSTHILLQVIYSPSSRKRFCSELLTAAGIVKLFLLCGVFYFSQFTPYLPLSIYFGLHFLSTEVYSSELQSRSPTITWLRLLTEGCIYGLCLHGLFPFDWIPRALLEKGVILGCAGLFFSAFMGIAGALPLLAYELVGAVFAFLLPENRSSLTDMSFYHILWWFFVPLLGSLKGNREAAGAWAGKYLLLSGVCTGFFLIFTPVIGAGSFSYESWMQAAIFLANLHVTLSMILSPANPRWVNLIFRSERSGSELLRVPRSPLAHARPSE